jgi:hypothetical protein
LIIDQEYVIRLFFQKQKSIFEVVVFLDGRLRKDASRILIGEHCRQALKRID